MDIALFYLFMSFDWVSVCHSLDRNLALNNFQHPPVAIADLVHLSELFVTLTYRLALSCLVYCFMYYYYYYYYFYDY